MYTVDYDKARFNMVEQQIRPWDVLNPRVLDVLADIPRELFMPEQYRSLAYVDTRIPLGETEGLRCTMLNPNIVGRILQALDIQPDDVALEIGTGSGYLTACMAKLARHVDSVDLNEDFIEAAESHLDALGIYNYCLSDGDACNGWDQQKQFYDAIAITGSMPEIPLCYKKRLKVGGRLFVVAGEEPAMKAYLVTRTGKNTWTEMELFETCLEPLAGKQKVAEFEF